MESLRGSIVGPSVGWSFANRFNAPLCTIVVPSNNRSLAEANPSSLDGSSRRSILKAVKHARHYALCFVLSGKTDVGKPAAGRTRCARSVQGTVALTAAVPDSVIRERDLTLVALLDGSD